MLGAGLQLFPSLWQAAMMVLAVFFLAGAAEMPSLAHLICGHVGGCTLKGWLAVWGMGAVRCVSVTGVLKQL
jgi:hypothetical protein